MIIDVVVGLVLVLALARGWMRGLVYQVLQLAVVIAALLSARALSDVLAPALAGELAAERVAQVVSFILIFIAVYVGGVILVRMLTRDLRNGRGLLTSSDRGLGAALGLAKGAILVYVVFVSLIMVHQLTGKVPIPYASSHTGRWVMQHNVLESEEFPRARALVKLGAVLHTRSITSLMRDPNFEAILKHPKARKLLNEETIRALAARDWVTLLGNDELWDLLDEPDIQAHLNALEWVEAEQVWPGDDEVDRALSEQPEPAQPPAPSEPRPSGTPHSPPPR